MNVAASHSSPTSRAVSCTPTSLRLTPHPKVKRHDAHAELAASQSHSSQRTHVSSHVSQYTCQCVKPPPSRTVRFDSAHSSCQLSHQKARVDGCRKSENDTSELPQHTLSLTELIPPVGSMPVMKTSRSSALVGQGAPRPCQNAQHSPRVPGTQRAPARQSVRRARQSVRASARAARALAIDCGSPALLAGFGDREVYSAVFSRVPETS